MLLGMKPEELKAWRTWMRWSQRNAAEALGISRGSIQLYENGQQPIPLAIELACGFLEQGKRSYRGPPKSETAA